jgi:hypothetical protein
VSRLPKSAAPVCPEVETQHALLLRTVGFVLGYSKIHEQPWLIITVLFNAQSGDKPESKKVYPLVN